MLVPGYQSRSEVAAALQAAMDLDCLSSPHLAMRVGTSEAVGFSTIDRGDRSPPFTIPFAAQTILDTLDGA
jgi:hypothetical protein